MPQEYHQLDGERLLVFGRVRASRDDASIDTPNAWLWQLRGEKVVAVRVYAEPGPELSWLLRRGR